MGISTALWREHIEISLDAFGARSIKEFNGELNYRY